MGFDCMLIAIHSEVKWMPQQTISTSQMTGRISSHFQLLININGYRTER